MIGEKSVDKTIADKVDELVEEVNRLTLKSLTDAERYESVKSV